MRFKKLLIWFLIVAIAIGYNFAIRLPKDEKNQIIKITPKQNSFKVSENPKFTLEINKSKSLRRFFRLVMLPWPVARAEEESFIASDPPTGGDEVLEDTGYSTQSEENRIINPVSSEETSPEMAPNDISDSEETLNQVQGDIENCHPEFISGSQSQCATSTDFVFETPDPQVLGEFTTTSQTTSETTTPLITPISPITSLVTITTTSTDTSLIGQALEKVGELIEQVGEIAQETLSAEPQVEVSVYDPTGEESGAKVEIEEIQDNQYEIALDDQGQKLPRGDWEIEVQIQQGVLKSSQHQSFNWGGREIPDKRNYTSKTYDNLDGSFDLEAHIGHIHYQDAASGQLEEIDTTLIDQGDKWTMDKASYHVKIPKYANEEMVFQDVFEDKNQTLTMIPQAKEVQGEIENTDGWQGKRVLYQSAFGPGLDLRVTAGNTGLFKEVIVNQRPKENQDLAFDFEIILPEGKSLYLLDSETKESTKVTDFNDLELTGDKQLLIGDENSFSYIQKIRIWDSAGNQIAGKLHFYQKEGKIYFQKIIPSQFLEMAVFPVYTDDTTTYYAGAGDGAVVYGNATLWSTAQNAADGTSADATSATLANTPGTGKASGTGYFIIRRTFYPVNTSTLSANATITAATFSIYVSAKLNGDNDGDDWLNIVQTSQAGETTLATSDYDNCGDAIDNPTEGATRIDLGSISTAAYNTWTLSATGQSWIELSGGTSNCGTTAGYTCLGIREGHDAIDSAYAGGTGTANAVSSAFSEQTGTSNDPYLSVTYNTYTVSGRVYTDEGGSNIGAGKTVVLKVNGTDACNGACTAETETFPGGAFSIASVAFSASNVITVFLDGENEKAVTVIRAPDPAVNVSGLGLYQNRLIVLSLDANPITNANLGQYDKDNDTDIHFTSNSNALTVDNDTELHVFSNYSYSPGGTITTSPGGSTPGGDIHLDDNSTLTAGGAISVGGSWTADSGSTFTPSSNGVTFTATGSGKTITPGSSSFYSLTFNGSGGAWTFQANATTTDNFTITAGTVTGPSSGHIAVAGNWANNGGTFTPNNSEVKFNASATGKTLSFSGSGNLIFYDTDFNSSSGGWTVQNNATSTNNWKLTAGGFTLNPNLHLEVNGSFTNITSGTTAWNSGSILFLNSGTAYTVNTKTAGADTYNTLEIGANTDIRMWNSSCLGSYIVNSSGSLYSMDHSASDGSLDIKGDYHVPASSTDYWNYAEDFDGTAGANRAATVLIADSSTVNVDSGTTLQILGTNTATTTISHWISGSYGLTVNNGTLNAQYYKFQYLNNTGLNLTGASATITNLANGEFDYSGGTGSSDTFITVAGEVITNNPAKTFSKCRFDNTGSAADYNITATGSTASYWTFSTSYGAFDGEANDSDPGGDPGYIRWDDSTSGTLSETASTSATFSSVTYSFSSQNDTGNLMGAVYISDSRGAAPGWDLNVTSADWSRTGGGSMDYDGNGSSTGQLCLVLSGASIYATSGSMTGVTKGSDDCFDSVTTQIQIGDATVGNGVGTYWLVDTTMSQFIPAMQQAGTYTTSLSIVAS